ncbi:MAG: hypothetical protein QOJ89_2485 [bacterium]
MEAVDRRELLRRGIGAGVALSATGLLVAARDARAAGEADRSILGAAIDREQKAVFTYDALLGAGVLGRRAERVVRLVRGQDQEHADALTTALTALGGAPPPKPSGGDADAITKRVAGLKSEAQALDFAIDLELGLVGGYHEALTTLYDAKLLQIAATITGSEGQHLVLLRQARGRQPVPNGIENGTSG